MISEGEPGEEMGLGEYCIMLEAMKLFRKCSPNGYVVLVLDTLLSPQPELISFVDSETEVRTS